MLQKKKRMIRGEIWSMLHCEDMINGKYAK
jgi:hypothetical protein